MPDREYRVWDKKGEEEEEWITFYRFSQSYKKVFIILLYNEANDKFNYND